MSTMPDHGMVHLNSAHSVSETLEKLEALLLKRGINVFARIDHQASAAAVGLTMPPATVVIFGSPKAGTPLMIAAPTSAIDLPMKALIWQDSDGKVLLSFNKPDYLQQRHNIPPSLLPNIAGASAIFEEAVR